MSLYSLDFPATTSGGRAPSIGDGAHTGLDITADFTIEFWYRETDTVSKSGNGIVAKTHSTGIRRHPYKVFLGSNEEIRVVVTNNAGGGGGADEHERFWSIPTLDDGSWHHVAITFDAAAVSKSTQFELFFDGTSQGGGTEEAGSDLVASLYDSDQDFYLGDEEGGSDLKGARLFDVRMWNDIRTPTEIADNRLIRIAATESNLVSNWATGASSESRDVAGNEILDRHANTNHLVIPEMAASEVATLAPDWPAAYALGSEVSKPALEIPFPTIYTSSINSGKTGFEATLGGVAVSAADTNPPVVANIVPSPGGALAATFEQARVTPIEFDVTDVEPGLALVLITLRYEGTSTVCVVHDGTNFVFPFDSATSARTVVTDGFHYTVLPRTGWRASPTMTVHRVDGVGNVGL